MTTFPDLAQFDDEATTTPLVLPINGREYSFVPEVPIARGIHIMRFREEARRAMKARDADERYVPKHDIDLDDDQEIELYLDLIGAEQRARMEADGVTYNQMVHVGSTLFSWHLAGRDAALRTWTRGKLDEGDVRPPDQDSAPSGQPRTSRSSSNRKKPTGSANKAGRKSSGATTSTGGGSSKRTSTTSTA